MDGGLTMGTNRRKAVRDRKKYQERHAEKVKKWKAKFALKVAKRLLGRDGWVTLGPIGQYPLEVEVGEWQSLASGDGQ